jgi:predicted RNA-binding Zn-ribbon protein involved in translation (DUF1610 family)
MAHSGHGAERFSWQADAFRITPIFRGAGNEASVVTAQTNLANRMEPLTQEMSLKCPWCGGVKLKRIPRRFIDRLISVISSQRRFRCESLGCGWEGNLSVGRLTSRDESTR